MSKSRIIGVVSSISLGFGCYLGVQLERFRQTDVDIFDFDNFKDTVNSVSATRPDGHLHVPTVSAVSSILPNSQAVAVVPPAKPSHTLAGSNVSEIMKYGFPSLDNIRTYDDFVLAYDKRTRTAHWVFEHLTAEKVVKAKDVDRNKSAFTEDNTIHTFFRATNADYKGSGYDRGHLAAAGNHMWAQGAMDQTFILSNMSPQVGQGFNQDAWNTLEKFVRHLTKRCRNVYVCTGPLYLPRREPDGKMYVKYEVIGMNNVAVPTHFFKVVVTEAEDGKRELLSFVMPNQALPEKVDLKSYLVPTEVIERAAGLLLFEKIPRKAFTKINGKKT